ncbi:hypothetical protein WJX72_005285 [[Myrmecia] bisecta]|uniref:Uncharacterized protein n=1 Tax=[Myrmecia] bisecta TaxID=41462 RepID=A0AAW1P7J3_9CHLO
MPNVPAIAALSAKAFAYSTLEELEAGPLKDALAGVERSLELKMQAQMEKQAAAALASKQKATLDAREARLRQQVAELRAELARVKGERRLFARAMDASARREHAKWRRSRKYARAALATRHSLPACRGNE